MMKPQTHKIITGLTNGYQPTEKQSELLERWLMEGYKIARPNTQLKMGEVSAQELLSKLTKYLEKR